METFLRGGKRQLRFWSLPACLPPLAKQDETYSLDRPVSLPFLLSTVFPNPPHLPTLLPSSTSRQSLETSRRWTDCSVESEPRSYRLSRLTLPPTPSRSCLGALAYDDGQQVLPRHGTVTAACVCIASAHSHLLADNALLEVSKHSSPHGVLRTEPPLWSISDLAWSRSDTNTDSLTAWVPPATSNSASSVIVTTTAAARACKLVTIPTALSSLSRRPLCRVVPSSRRRSRP